MLREDLLKKLATVSPALADTDAIPLLRCYWFDGEHLLAYNDRIAIRVPLATDFKGAVPKHFVDLLSASAAPEVILKNDQGGLLVKAGKGHHFRVPLMEIPPDLFTMPDSAVEAMRGDPEAWQAALDCCFLSLSTDAARPEYLGVSVAPQDGSGLTLYATDGKTLSKAVVEDAAVTGQDVVLPWPFCQQMRKLLKKDTAIKIGFHADHALLTVGDVTVYGRLIAREQALNFAAIFDRHQGNSHFVGLPRGFDYYIERAAIIAGTATAAERASRATISKNILTLDTQTPMGEARDSARFEHPDIDIFIDPVRIKNAVDYFESIAFNKTCVVLRASTRFHVIAALDRTAA